jgi:zinc protease
MAMRLWLLSFVALALVSLVAGCRGKPLTEDSFRLENGLQVELTATSRGEEAALVLLFRVGADHDPPEHSGMAHLVDHLFLTSGVTGKPARTVEQLAERYGEKWRTQTGADFTMVSVVVPAERLVEEIDELALRMSRLELTEADLARERPRLLGKVASMREKDATAAAINHAAEAIRPSRGEGWRGGIAAEIAAIKLAELEAFRRAHYAGKTARLLVAGRFDVKAARTRIEASFSKVPTGDVPKPRTDAVSRVTGTLVMGDAPSSMALAVPVPDVKDPLYPAFLVLAARLTNPSQASRSWKADFEPLDRPDVLFVTEPLAAGAPPEAAAARLRQEVSAIVEAPLAAGEAAQALETLERFLGAKPLQAAAVAGDPHATAVARGRRADLGLDGKAVAKAIEALADEQLTKAATLFDTQNSAAVIAAARFSKSAAF